MKRLNRRRLALGTGTLLLMSVLFVIYAVLHSPARRPIWNALFGECDWFCKSLRPDREVLDITSSIWFLGAVFIGAMPLAWRAVRGSLERVVAWGLIAYALLVIPAALVAYLGDLVGLRLLLPPIGPVLASLPAVIAIAWGLRAGWRPSWPRGESGIPMTPAIVLLAFVIVAAVLVQAGFAIRYPVSGFDDMGYHAPLSVLYWHEGSMTAFLDRFGDTPVLSHPGGTELWQGLLLMIGGEPLALLGQLPFALLGAAAVGLFGRRLGLRPGAAALAGMFYLMVPLLLEQIGHIRDDVAGAAIVAVTVAFLVGGSREGLPGRLTLGILGIGMMLVTKLALLPAAGAMTLLVLWILVREHRSGRRDMAVVWKAFGLGVLLAALAVAPWWLRNLVREGNPLFPLNLPIIGRGMKGAVPIETRFVPNRLLWPFYPWLEHYGVADGLGGAYAVGIIPGMVAAAFIARRRALGALALLALVSISMWWFLDRREPRFLLGLAALSFALIPFALVALHRRWRNAAVGLLVAASCVTLGAQLWTLSPDANVERLAFYDEMWGTDPVALALPERDGILVDDRCGQGLGRLYPWFGVGQNRKIARQACEEATPADTLKKLKADKLSYVAVLIPQDMWPARQAQLYPADKFTIVHEGTTLLSGDVMTRVLLRWNGAPKGPDADQPAKTPKPGKKGPKASPVASPAPSVVPSAAPSTAPAIVVTPAPTTAPAAASPAA